VHYSAVFGGREKRWQKRDLNAEFAETLRKDEPKDKSKSRSPGARDDIVGAWVYIEKK
jgi:hypothetical protein